MNDTVTKLMGIADEYALRCSTAHVSIEPARQALQDELTRLFTPLTDEQATKFLRDECIYTSEDICGWSFGQGAKWAEKQHGITGEKNETDE